MAVAVADGPGTAGFVVRGSFAQEEWVHIANRGSDMSGGNWKEMFNAACDGDIGLVEYHLKAGADVNFAHPEFLATPLVASILARQEEVAQFLLENGADPHLLSESDGLLPLQAARQVGLARVEASLIALGAQAPVVAPQRASRWRWWSQG